jgi:hypothetical protein
MNARPKITLLTALLACCALSATSFAAPSDHHFDRPSPESHDNQTSSPPPPPPPPPPPSPEVHHGAPPDVRGGAPSHEFRGPPPDFHGQPPSRDFHGVPPDFRGQLPSRGFRRAPPDFQGTPNVGDQPRTPRELRDRNPQALDGSAPRDLRGPRSRTPGATTPPAVSAFVERHDVTRFTPQQREAWTHGSWHHTWHHGHFGWWWFLNDFWFFYPEPFYPFPSYVGTYYDEYDDGYADDGYWYWCDDPRGYYPYIQECESDWIPVPPQPY